jgi:hypothetical protein
MRAFGRRGNEMKAKFRGSPNLIMSASVGDQTMDWMDQNVNYAAFDGGTASTYSLTEALKAK